MPSQTRVESHPNVSLNMTRALLCRECGMTADPPPPFSGPVHAALECAECFAPLTLIAYASIADRATSADLGRRMHRYYRTGGPHA